jgi:hypothetical protein
LTPWGDNLYLTLRKLKLPAVSLSPVGAHENGEADMIGKLILASAAAALSAGEAFATTYDYTLLQAPNSVLTTPSAINDSGVVVGDYQAAGGGDLGFIYSDGTYTTLRYPGETGTTPIPARWSAVTARDPASAFSIRAEATEPTLKYATENRSGP